ncbi:MAG: sigma-70 family RNA polymerase sigma factor [Rhodoglobus sp.]
MTSSSEESFETLLAAAQRGAAWACTTIWVSYAPAVSAFLVARGSREPEDLTSEVFLTLFERLDSFTGGERELRTFVFSLAYRRLVDELRSRSRRGEMVEWTQESDPRSTPSAEAEAITRLGDARARALLDGLPDQQRDVMVLRIVADLTVEQVALVLGKRPGAVKALQQRALANLRKSFPRSRILSGPSDDSGE